MTYMMIIISTMHSTFDRQRCVEIKPASNVIVLKRSSLTLVMSALLAGGVPV